MFRNPGWRTLRVLAPLALVASAACSDGKTLLEPDVKALKYSSCETQIIPDPECGGGGSFSTSWDYYGDYYHYSGAASHETDVDNMQQVAHANDVYAFDEYSRDWNNPDAYAVAAWPAAVGAGVRAAVGAGRALARTTRFRNAVGAGARWATNVAAGVAASMLYGGFPLAQGQAVEDVPLQEFDFMFDYALQ